MKEIKGSWLILCSFLGIVIGTVFTNGMERLHPETLLVLAIDQYSISNWITQERKGLVLYLLRQRGIQFVILLILGLASNAVISAFLFMFVIGFLWGLILSLETMRLGIQGVLLAIVCFLPHGICYVLAAWIFWKDKIQMIQNGKNAWTAYAKRILIPMVITGFGILLEGFLSPDLIQWVMKQKIG